MNAIPPPTLAELEAALKICNEFLESKFVPTAEMIAKIIAAHRAPATPYQRELLQRIGVLEKALQAVDPAQAHAAEMESLLCKYHDFNMMHNDQESELWELSNALLTMLYAERQAQKAAIS